jgi:phenylglyoxylate dehydrogenase beta subunit
MKAFHNTIKIGPGKCPPGCSICQDRCLEINRAAGCSAITPVHLGEADFHTAIVCNQCGEPACEACCPTGAIVKDPDSGIVGLNQEKCLGCGLCSLMCPYGGMAYHAETKQAFTCDQCGGDPECVKACPSGVLSLIRNEPLRAHFQIEDPLSHGTAMCAGCPAEIAHRFTLRVLGRNVILVGAPGCACSMILGVETPEGIKSPETIPCHMALLTNVASVMTGMKRYYQRIGRDVKVVSFVGDGATADIGFQPLSGAA